MILGAFAAVTLYGVTSVQSLVYFFNPGRDDRYMDSTVLISWIINSAHTGFIILPPYRYLVASRFHQGGIVELIWTLGAGVVLTAINDGIVRGWLLYRIWLASECNRYITLPLVAVVATLFVTTTASGVESIHSKTQAEFTHVAWSMRTNLTLRLATDSLIAGILTVLLERTGQISTGSNSRSYVKTIIIYTMSTGLLASLLTCACIIAIVTKPNDLGYMAFCFPLGGLYANALLAWFNMLSWGPSESPNTARLDSKENIAPQEQVQDDEKRI